MKQYIRNIMMAAACMLATATAWGESSVSVVMQLDGEGNNAAGTVVSNVSNGVPLRVITSRQII